MTSVADIAAQVFRDYESAGSPEPHSPVLAEVRALFRQVGLAISAMGFSASSGGYMRLTGFDMWLIPTPPTGSLCMVVADPANNGIYARSATDWVRQADLPFQLSADALSEIQTLTSDVVGLRADVNAALAAADRTGGLLAAIAAAEAAARARDNQALPIPYPLHHRPGDAPLNFASSLGDGEAALASLSSVTATQFGMAARLSGAGIVASRWLYAVEPGRTYSAIFVVTRSTDTADPANDAVRCGIDWHGQDKGRLTRQSIASDLTALRVSSGRTIVRKTVAAAAATGVDLVAPVGAIYARLFVQGFGATAATDVEVIGWNDITDAGAAPPLSALNDRIATLESVSAGARLAALESAASAPGVQVVLTLGSIAGTTVQPSVQIVRTLGGSAVGDGGAMDLKRDASGAYTSADGAKWKPFFPLHGAFSQLPASTDGSAPAGVPVGGVYLNGNFISVRTA